MIEVHHLTKIYGTAAAVRDATFRIEAGEVVGFLGPNGAGKTTTIRMLTGYLPPTSGSAAIDGLDVFRRGDDVRARIGYLPENVPLYGDLRVDEYLRFRAAQKRLPRAARPGRIDHVVQRCGLTDVRRKVIGTLSRGFRQRVGLADALVADPPVLILDEPTSGFDPLQRLEMRDLILDLARGGKHTILFSSHILSEVQAVARRLLVIARGTIVADGAAQDLIRRFGENRYHVEALGDEKSLREALQGIAGIRAIERATEPACDGATRLALVAEPEADPREAIFETCAKRGVRLRELASDRAPLEVIFARLVAGQVGDEVPLEAPHVAVGGAA
jgi:ABC-2 type transport system ATP-binding protein